MAVSTKFYNWQRSSKNPAASEWNFPSPNLVALQSFLLSEFGGAPLGIHGDRPIRNGTSHSSHAFGSALDWRYGFHADVKPYGQWVAQTTLSNEVLPFLIDNSAELGVQAIHRSGEIWRAGRGWRPYNTGYGTWLHIETHPDSWADGRTIAERLETEVQPSIPDFDPDNRQWSLFPLDKNKPNTGPGSRGQYVEYIQGVLKANGADLAVDGHFGPVTTEKVMQVQRFFGLEVDGWVGRQTWPVIDLIAGLNTP